MIRAAFCRQWRNECWKRQWLTCATYAASETSAKSSRYTFEMCACSLLSELAHDADQAGLTKC